jgi:hypothetical protein
MQTSCIQTEKMGLFLSIIEAKVIDGKRIEKKSTR